MIKQKIETLRRLKNGWLNGYGRAPLPENLDWFESVFLENYQDGLPEPDIHPTIFGSIQLEWVLGDCQISLSVSFKTRQGHWRKLNDRISDHAQTIDFDLSNPNAWKSIERHLRNAIQEGDTSDV